MRTPLLRPAAMTAVSATQEFGNGEDNVIDVAVPLPVDHLFFISTSCRQRRQRVRNRAPGAGAFPRPPSRRDGAGAASPIRHYGPQGAHQVARFRAAAPACVAGVEPLGLKLLLCATRRGDPRDAARPACCRARFPLMPKAPTSGRPGGSSPFVELFEAPDEKLPPAQQRLIEVVREQPSAGHCQFAPAGRSERDTMLSGDSNRRAWSASKRSISSVHPGPGRCLRKSSDTSWTPDQTSALETLKAGLGQGFSRFLVHGITGSGKTELYLNLIEEALDGGGTALMMVPRDRADSADRRAVPIVVSRPG